MDEANSPMRFEGIDDTPIYDIDITNDFMFAYVMSKSDVCIELLRCLLPDRNISSIKYIDADDPDDDQRAPVTQKALITSADKRSVRLDVYLDDGHTVYNVELQTVQKPYFAKRARLYQAHMDIHQLKRGQNYDQLKPSFVIFLCKFDPFGQNLYRYSFENQCSEAGGLKLNDEAYKLFFCTTGTKGDINGRQKELLKYMNDVKTYPVRDTSDELIRMINDRVDESLKSTEWRNAYMTYQIRQRDAELIGEQRGIQIGEQRGIQIGEQRGMLRGKRERDEQIAQNMLAAGMSVNIIASITGLTVSEIKALSVSVKHERH